MALLFSDDNICILKDTLFNINHGQVKIFLLWQHPGKFQEIIRPHITLPFSWLHLLFY